MEPQCDCDKDDDHIPAWPQEGRDAWPSAAALLFLVHDWRHCLPRSGYELLRYASCIHMLPRLPDALLVDDLHALCDLPAGDRPRPRDMALCRVLAALHEAAVRAGCRVCARLDCLHACRCQGRFLGGPA